jgi:hypothetical protein
MCSTHHLAVECAGLPGSSSSISADDLAISFGACKNIPCATVLDVPPITSPRHLQSA